MCSHLIFTVYNHSKYQIITAESSTAPPPRHVRCHNALLYVELRVDTHKMAFLNLLPTKLKKLKHGVNIKFLPSKLSIS